VRLTPEALAHVKGFLLTSPREVSGKVLSAVDKTLNEFEGPNSASFIDKWYRSAEEASYDTVEAAAAYLGAYGPRSVLKYQEAFLAMLVTKAALKKHTRVIDYGAGPGIGFAALSDLYNVLHDCTGEELTLDYLGIDRSYCMLEVGKNLCSRISATLGTKDTYRLFDIPHFTCGKADVLIIANVMNDGEGNLSCREFLSELSHKIHAIEDLIVIEPATEQPARQMCGIAEGLESIHHIGPCPSALSSCEEWSFRQFSKRVYSCERRCLGQWASAARICKYSLALLSTISAPRVLPDKQYVIVGQPSLSGYAMTCHHGQKQLMKIDPSGKPWDTVNAQGHVERWWP
jgi:hypothetical protein